MNYYGIFSDKFVYLQENLPNLLNLFKAHAISLPSTILRRTVSTACIKYSMVMDKRLPMYMLGYSSEVNEEVIEKINSLLNLSDSVFQDYNKETFEIELEKTLKHYEIDKVPLEDTFELNNNLDTLREMYRRRDPRLNSLSPLLRTPNNIFFDNKAIGCTSNNGCKEVECEYYEQVYDVVGMNVGKCKITKDFSNRELFSLLCGYGITARSIKIVSDLLSELVENPKPVAILLNKDCYRKNNEIEDSSLVAAITQLKHIPLPKFVVSFPKTVSLDYSCPIVSFSFEELKPKSKELLTDMILWEEVPNDS